MSQNPLDKLPFASSDSNRIEGFLLDAVSVSTDPEFTDITSHLIKAGGKRQRPRFTIAAAGAGTKDVSTELSDDVVAGGVAVELVQVGSLYHDDVLDEAEIRRNVDSVNARWGNVKAILAGDYLLAKASEIAAGLGTEVVELLSITISELCKGQVTELRFAYNQARTEADYFESIEGKTAYLFSTSTRIGGIVAELDSSAIERLTAFGRYYGLAFQIVDDVLDLTQTEEKIGKPAGNDIVEGTYSLPVIKALASDVGPELSTLLVEGIDEAATNKAIDLIRSSTAIEDSLKQATAFAEQAKQEILAVSDNVYAQALTEMTQRLIEVDY